MMEFLRLVSLAFVVISTAHVVVLGDECNATWGYVPPDSTNWEANRWSRSIAVGLAGNSKRTEQYRIRRPGCPAECQARVTPMTGLEAMKNSSCPVSRSHLGHVTVAGGTKHACGLSEAGMVACWGRDKLGCVTGASAYKDIKFKSIAAERMYTCGITAASCRRA